MTFRPARPSGPAATAVLQEVGRTCRAALRDRGWLGLARAAVPLALVLNLALFGSRSSALAGLVDWLVPFAYFWLLAWCLRACLTARDPQAEGGQIPLERHLWRLILAHLATIGVPGAGLFVASMLRGISVDVYVIMTMVMTFAMFPAALLAMLTGAQVAARGLWSPILVWQALRGSRFAALGLMAAGAVVAWVAGPVALLILLGVTGTGLIGRAVGLVLSLGIIGFLVLILSAFATVVFARYAR